MSRKRGGGDWWKQTLLEFANMGVNSWFATQCISHNSRTSRLNCLTSWACRPLQAPVGLTALWGDQTAKISLNCKPSIEACALDALTIKPYTQSLKTETAPTVKATGLAHTVARMRAQDIMDRPTTPLSGTSFRAFEASPVDRKGTFGPLLTPVTPARSIKRLGTIPFSEIIDENDKLVVPKNTRRPNPSTANTALRLSTASLGAVRRSETSSSAITALNSFYSALEDEGDDGARRTVVSTLEGPVEMQGDGSNVSEVANFADSLRERRESYDTTMYEPSSAPSSPQRGRGGDDSTYHFSSHLSPPPRASMIRQSILIKSAPSSPKQAATDLLSPAVNKTPLPRLLSSTSTQCSLSSSNITLKSPRARFCTYTSIHTGIRCHAPTTELQTLCPIHLHHARSPGMNRGSIDQSENRRVRRDDSISKAFRLCDNFQSARNSPRRTPYTRSPARHSSDDNLQGNNLLTGLAIPSYMSDSDGMQTATNSPTLLVHPPSNQMPAAGYPLSNLATIPSTARSASFVESGEGELYLGYPFIDNGPMIPGCTVIDWKTNESRRREYEEADRRRKGLWGWLRRRIRSLCCVKDQSEFWEGGPDGGDGGSVRRYRLVLPEEQEKDKAAEPEEIGFVSVVTASQTAASGADWNEPASVPSTAGGVRNSFAGRQENKLEGVVVRRASVAGELRWRGASSMPPLKDLSTVSVLEKVDSYGSTDSHAYNQGHDHMAVMSGQPPPSIASSFSSPRRVVGKSKSASEDSTSFWRRRKGERWSSTAVVL
ncbi:hypothetical protein BGX38DRAFT_1139161 [Terfezia claveryi]|nr:hypothetical protein BGX38DRAFT_1139161 [Terfezia claveryi]